MAVSAFLIGFASILTGGLKLLILGIKKLMGAARYTATITEYKQLNGKDQRMYLNIDHERAVTQMWLDEFVHFKNGKPEKAVGETIEVYWIPGRKTATRADFPKRNVITMLIGVAAIAIGVILMFAGTAME